ncbi:MAG: lexA [Proteobacteria bacterium]|nr:lexA [Pseudomonadota bacterium]
MAQELTERQNQILQFIREKIARDGYAPTLMEIGKQFGINNPNGVKSHLVALERKGFISRDKEMARAMRVEAAPAKAAPHPHLITTLKKKIWQHNKYYTHLHYHLGLTTRKAYPFFHGKWKDMVEEKIRKVAADHDWHIARLDIDSAAVTMELLATPDHSIERVVNNIKNFTNLLAVAHPLYFHGKRLWATGFAGATDEAAFNELFRLYKESLSNPEKESA